MDFETKRIPPYFLVNPSMNESERFDLASFERLIHSGVDENNRAVVLSLQSIVADHIVLVGIIVACNQIVRKHGGYLMLLETQKAILNALHDICFFLDILIVDSEDELQGALAGENVAQ